MNITFKDILIQNFMSIGDISLNLDDMGFSYIDGVNSNSKDSACSNGSGKSSIFEALVWCITGSTIRGNKSIVNKYGDDGTLVRLHFIVDADDYVLIRTKDHSKYKTNLQILVNGVDKSGKGIRDSESLLKDYLPDITAQLIGSVIVLGQGMPNKFTNNTPSGRKEVLEKLFKSDYMIEDLKSRIANRKDELQTEIRSVEDLELTKSTELSVAKKSLDAKKSELVNMGNPETLTDEIEKNSLIVSELKSKKDSSKNDVDNLTNEHKELCDILINLQDKLSSVNKESDDRFDTDINEKREENQRLLLEIKSKEIELDKVNSISDICPTCGQKLIGVEKPDTSDLENSILELKSLFENAKDELDKLIKEKESYIEYKKSPIESSIRELKTKINEVSHEKDSLNKDITKIESQLAETNNALMDSKFRYSVYSDKKSEIENSIKDFEKSINSTEKELEKLSKRKEELMSRSAINSRFSTIVSRDFRGYLLNDIVVYINMRAKSYGIEVFGNDSIEFCLDGNNLLITFDGKEYESLSGGERQKVDIIVQFAIRDMLIKNTSFSSNIIVMDEIFDNLDSVGCAKIVDLITNKLTDVNSIYIITHHGNELNIPCDNHIKVEKDDSGITRLCV